MASASGVRTVAFEGFVQQLRGGDEWWEQRLFVTTLRGREARGKREATTDTVDSFMLMFSEEGERIKAHLAAKGIDAYRTFQDSEGGLPVLHLNRKAALLLALRFDLDFAEWIAERAYDSAPGETRRRALAVLGQPDIADPNLRADVAHVPPHATVAAMIQPLEAKLDEILLRTHRLSGWDAEHFQPMKRALSALENGPPPDRALTNLIAHLDDVAGDHTTQHTTIIRLVHDVLQALVRVCDSFTRIDPHLRQAVAEYGEKWAAQIMLLIAKGESPLDQRRLDL
jgi:hypothetical protein